MNCKPGDLAVIIGGTPTTNRNSGRIVSVIAPFGDGESWWIRAKGQPLDTDHGPIDYSIGCLDRCLRPIRDQPGEDEMLRIAGKPQDQREPA